MELKVGDRVRYIREDTEEDKATGFFPPIGTLGTVHNIDHDALHGVENMLVAWDKGTKGDGIWWCYATDVEKVEGYKNETCYAAGID